MSTTPQPSVTDLPSVDRAGNTAPGENVIIALERLTAIGTELRSMGQWLILYIGVAIVFQGVAASGYVTLSASKMNYFVPGCVAPVSMLLVLFAASLLLRWDHLRRKGMAIFEEVSDEIEWRHRTFKPSKPRTKPLHALTGDESEVGSAVGPRPGLNVRLRLRDFLTDATLPITQSNNPGAVYAVLIAALFLTDMFLMIAISRATTPINWAAF